MPRAKWAQTEVKAFFGGALARGTGPAEGGLVSAGLQPALNVSLSRRNDAVADEACDCVGLTAGARLRDDAHSSVSSSGGGCSAGGAASGFCSGEGTGSCAEN